MIPIAFTLGGYRLVLAGLRLGGFWIATGVVALALVIVLYRYERKLVSRKMGLALLSLRVIAASALVAALFEPISARSYRETIRGRVIVGVDLSESMATADPSRSLEERTKLMKTLGLGPTEPIDALPRREIARRFLGGDWRSPIEKSHDVEVVGFARDATPFGSTRALLEILKSPEKPDDPSGLDDRLEPGPGARPEGRRCAGGWRGLADRRPPEWPRRLGGDCRQAGVARDPGLPDHDRLHEAAARRRRGGREGARAGLSRRRGGRRGHGQDRRPGAGDGGPRHARPPRRSPPCASS